MVLSLLNSPVARSIVATHSLPEVRIEEGDHLRYDPGDPDVVVVSFAVQVEDLVAAIRRRLLVASGDVASAPPKTPRPHAPAYPNGRASTHLRVIP